MSCEEREAVREGPWSSVPASRHGARGGENTDASESTQAAATHERVFDFVRQLAEDLSAGELDLPSLPGVVMRIKSVLEDDNSTVDTIADVVGSEPALAARLMTMANPAAFSRGGIEVTDLRSAVGRLGHDIIRTSAMAFAMQKLMDRHTVAKLRPHLRALWNHSITVAAMANAIGKRTNAVNADEAMFLGLIHDIGKLYILSRVAAHPDLFNCAEAMARIIADCHDEIGKAIVESWEIPQHMADAVGDHSDCGREKSGGPDILDVLIAANALGNALDGGGFGGLDFEGVSAFSRLQITAESVDEFVEESREEIAALMSALKG